MNRKNAPSNSRGLKIYYTHGIIFPNMTKDEFDDYVGDADVIERRVCVFKDELQSSVRLLNALKKIAAPYLWKFSGLTESEMASYRDIIFPVVKIDSDKTHELQQGPFPSVPTLALTLSIGLARSKSWKFVRQSLKWKSYKRQR